ncbi:flavodoxin [Fodinibius sediminis]|uniref:Flavodoxin n=1 Tax=Fodinibius sediminis TaxID=1214077 RepID=A0A521DBI8_9BACT|nr:flavodoxin [Fodinibius sediminis]SMO69077.1 Flavodoxin [Fodinibius sediminis]
MKQKNSFTLLLAAFIGLISCSSNAQEQDVALPEVDQEKMLIVYLSRTGNTRAIAEIIHQKVGGNMIELKLRKPYPENYDAIVAQVDRENEKGYLPPLETDIDNIQAYNTILIGFPTWDMQLPPPMKSFLSKYDLSGKTVIPFNTNGGYGLGSSIQQINSLCPDSNVLEAFSLKGGLEKEGIHLAIKGERRKEAKAEVVSWLREIGIHQ